MNQAAEKTLRRLPLVLIICSVLGLAGAVMGIGSLATWREPIPEVQGIELPEAPKGEEAAWARLEEVTAQLPAIYAETLRERRPAVTALAGTNLVASSALLFGAFAAWARRPWSARSLRTGLSLSQAYALLALLVNGWVQLAVLERVRSVVAPLAEAGGQIAIVASSVVGAHLGALAFTVLWALGQLAFYLWGSAYLRRPGVAEAIAPPA